MASKYVEGRYWSPDRRELRAKLEALAIRYPVEGQANKEKMAEYFHTKRNEGYDDSQD